MICPSCEKPVQPDWAFCPHCNVKLPEPPPTPTVSSQHNYERRSPEPRSSKNGKIILCIIAVAITVFGLNEWVLNRNNTASISQATQLLTEGFLDNSVLEKVQWGKIDEAKKALSPVANLKSVDVDKIKNELLERDRGMQILAIKKDLPKKKDDFAWLSNSYKELSSIPNTSRYASHLPQLQAQMEDLLDVMYLSRAELALKNANISEVWTNLSSISKNTKIKSEAEELRIKADELQKEALAVAEYIARDGYGKTLEKTFLKQGMDVYVSLSGENHEYLNLEYVLWSRPLVMKFADEGKIIQTARTLGFKKVTFDSGYRSSWWYDL